MARGNALSPSEGAAVFGVVMTLCAALDSGCGHTVSMRHPLLAGAVDPNEVVIRGWQHEEELHLPSRTLEDTASLIELSPSRLCFHLTRWSTNEKRRVDPTMLSLTMFGDSEEPRRESISVAQGHRFERQVTGTRDVRIEGKCRQEALGRCVRWAVPPRTERQPFEYTVIQTEATACFPNEGVITPASRAVRLEVRGGEGSQRFEWLLGPLP